MNKLRNGIFCVALVVSLFWGAEVKATEVVDRIVAVVNEEVITLSELEAVVDMTPKEGRPILEQKMESYRREALESLIDNLLLKHAIAKANIEVEEDELVRAIASVLRQNRMTPEELRADLAKKGISYETYKEQISEQIKMIKFINQVIGSQVKLDDRELRDYYNQHRDMFGGEDSTYEAMKEKVHDALYEEKTQEALSNYLMHQRQRSYIDIRL